jgi:hypothetical protein
MEYYLSNQELAISIRRKFANEFGYIGIDEHFVDATECIEYNFPKSKN